jgi:hypothetical protein
MSGECHGENAVAMCGQADWFGVNMKYHLLFLVLSVTQDGS